MGIHVDYSLLNSLDTSKIKKKERFVEYVLHIGDDKHSFLVEESISSDFEEQFSKTEINSYSKFVKEFGPMISEKTI